MTETRETDTAWQPIETAPRDGTLIIGWEPGDVPRVCWPYWRTDQEGLWRYSDAFHGSYAITPTHWMPLPDPPSILNGQPS